MLFEGHFWRWVKKELSVHALKNKKISQCYIRHSAAFGPQNPFLSDFDLAFFVHADNYDEFCKVRQKIIREFKGLFIIGRMVEIAVFPQTQKAMELCRSNYPFRSVYPYETWLAVDEEKVSKPLLPKFSVPLDLRPELLINLYIANVVRGNNRKPLYLEDAFLRRKLEIDLSLTSQLFPENDPRSLVEVLCAEINIWDKFYKKLEFIENREKIDFHCYGRFDYPEFSRRWEKAVFHSKGIAGLSSLWVYPSSHWDEQPNVSLNLKPDIPWAECQEIIRIVVDAFKDLNYSLFLGTQEAMLGRISGLSGHALFDPWLFKYHGCCLFGDGLIKEKVKEPALQAVSEKYRDFVLVYLMMAKQAMIHHTYRYPVYRHCFTLDHLLKHHEIILDDKELSKIYGPPFITEDKFDPKTDTMKFLSALKEKHHIDFFED